ncbi:FKBP-type peptidyl-prolyl cis-trans isomerase [Pelomonas sp. SE-A7]|uniref:FKBP-type peptidyl-prolyl cis-trans isomerase n=1 Tax=Pelomonas sp. SE-A7 TaxID=3054953 RepID=UPI00259CF847|nr:FKBP-type peptidyl-prolyl cis-trans isomerase [Pelomonas sp. SE-A7]MDM4765358.1 FKBP-type peptidyl-prolyl cis-trans isomerase [Pelomonas sp. SE-A7]
MKITKDTVATLHLKVADAKGMLIEASKEPMACLIGGYGNTLPAIEEALEGQEAGFQATLNLSVEQAFGPRDENLVRLLAKKDFPPGVKVGGQLELRESANGEFKLYNVVKVKGDTVHLDGNHPLAGMALKVMLKVASVRAASAEEVAHGHAHGDHGVHH